MKTNKQLDEESRWSSIWGFLWALVCLSSSIVGMVAARDEPVAWWMFCAMAIMLVAVVLLDSWEILSNAFWRWLWTDVEE